MASAETFWQVGHKITRYNTDCSIAVGYRKFRSFFGVSPSVCATVYANLSSVRSVKSRPKHLLWTLLHLKNYATEHINAALVGVSEKTFRKWCHIFIRLLAYMPVVCDNIHSLLIQIYSLFVYIYSLNGRIVFIEPLPPLKFLSQSME